MIVQTTAVKYQARYIGFQDSMDSMQRVRWVKGVLGWEGVKRLAGLEDVGVKRVAGEMAMARFAFASWLTKQSQVGCGIASNRMLELDNADNFEMCET
ncbi:uncharacterized protein RAG0_10030 [Rhynchosporium agropyri]|uniref:Uncharacterized protein n=1 Tax=Rhynchosporium agropyri TaxID=914238 RepID=A0A1E1L0Z3_9HELO|nr:uncharacterized protein RAG0_10030 [Rhynchosporium agropyri]